MDALKGPGKSLAWSPALDYAFPHAKDLLSSVPELMQPRPDALIALAVDALDSLKILDGSWTPPGILLQEAIVC